MTTVLLLVTLWTALTLAQVPDIAQLTDNELNHQEPQLEDDETIPPSEYIHQRDLDFPGPDGRLYDSFMAWKRGLRPTKFRDDLGKRSMYEADMELMKRIWTGGLKEEGSAKHRQLMSKFRDDLGKRSSQQEEEEEGRNSWF